MSTRHAMETATQRRVKYGVNVTVALVVAIALVVGLNFVMYRASLRAPAKLKHVMRIHVGQGRGYRLSPQTEQLLANMKKPVRVVSLLNPDDDQLTQAIDLLDEYRALSDKLNVEIINPARDLLRRDAFYESIQKRFDDKLGPLKEAINKGEVAIDSARSDTQAMVEPLRKLNDDPNLPAGATKTLVQRIYGAIRLLAEDELKGIKTRLEELTGDNQPDYASAKQLLEQQLQALDEVVYAVAIDQFEQGAQAADVPGEIKEQMLKLVEMFHASRRGLSESLKAVRDAKTVEGYDELRRAIGRNTIVFLTDDQHRILRADELFRSSRDQPTGEDGQEATPEFQGEERITGVLASLNLDHDPMVVFATSSATSRPVGFNSPYGYDYIAERLTNAHFAVESWSSAPMRQGMPPQPAPEPVEGQKAVWVYVSPVQPEPPNQMGPMFEQMLVNQIKQRMDKGEGVMLVLSPSYMMLGGGGSPFDDLLKEFGLDAQLDRMIFQELVDNNRKKRAMPQYPVNRFPEDTPIGKAVQGLPSMFLESCPIILPSAEEQEKLKVKAWPLVTVDLPRLWASTDFARSEGEPKYDETTAKDQFVVAAAAEKDGKRLVVTTDRRWATSQVATAGQDVFGLGRILYFPGNTELFVNSMYWLAHIDEMIAASARRQDVRRIDPIKRSTEWTVQIALIVGMPLIVLACGLGVWMKRRA